VSWHNNHALQSLVYNRDFVRENFNQTSKLKGIFTLGKQDIDVQNQIAQAKSESDAILVQMAQLKSTLEGNQGNGGKRADLVVIEDSFRDECWKLKVKHQGKLLPAATITFEAFIERFFFPNALPTLKQSTRRRYRSTINHHLIPAFGQRRLCDISTLELQSFVLRKGDSGSGWEVCNHLRNLMSKIFATAKKWGHFAGDNPAAASIFRRRFRFTRNTRSQPNKAKAFSQSFRNRFAPLPSSGSWADCG
jgi:hypothetical protein